MPNISSLFLEQLPKRGLLANFGHGREGIGFKNK